MRVIWKKRALGRGKRDRKRQRESSKERAREGWRERERERDLYNYQERFFLVVSE